MSDWPLRRTGGGKHLKVTKAVQNRTQRTAVIFSSGCEKILRRQKIVLNSKLLVFQKKWKSEHFETNTC